ncbi:hypothetical protein LNAOJCKE_3327 [Methylorubrum aminovorans]|uniref:Uncharacterized protein n=1 Tax=Methylorubrum aminovorans TaxID=269069 RepID=A0ABQ4UHQ2_9HYPH|nr:hypothetical protein LNAOJCKE_3327 [Methylorubrum aminovorans]
MNAPRLLTAPFVARSKASCLASFLASCLGSFSALVPVLSLVFSLVLALSVIGGSLGAAAAGLHDLDTLEAAWHGCVREAYARQRPEQGRVGAQRNTLDECREHEDRLVAATMREQVRADEAARRAGLPLSVRAGAWAASVAAYVVDPVSSWLQGWRGAAR